jgi:hypothetical protein
MDGVSNTSDQKSRKSTNSGPSGIPKEGISTELRKQEIGCSKPGTGGR